MFGTLLSQIRLLFVCNVLPPYSGLKLSAIFLRYFVFEPSVDFREKFYGGRHKETPPSRALNAKGVAK